MRLLRDPMAREAPPLCLLRDPIVGFEHFFSGVGGVKKMGCSFSHAHYHGRRWSPGRWSPARWSPHRRSRKNTAVRQRPVARPGDNDDLSPTLTPRNWSPLPRQSGHEARWSPLTSFRRRHRGMPPPSVRKEVIVRTPHLGYNRHFFIGFAIDRYVNATWCALQNCVRDVEAVADRLALLGFHAQTFRNEECTRAGLARILDKQLAEQLDEDDLLVLMFAGHGSPSFFACHDTGHDACLRHDKYTRLDLDRLCRDCRARHLLVIVDVCFGGGFVQFCTPFASEQRTMRSSGGSSLLGRRRSSSSSSRVRSQLMVRRDLLEARTRLVLTSGPADTTVPDGSDDHSPFTAALLRALPTSPPTGLFGVVSDLVGRLRRDASIATTPMLGRGPTDEGGDVLFGV